MKKVNQLRTALSFGLSSFLISTVSHGQDDVWNGLARSQFDSSALTLRVPCAVVEDENGNAVPGLAPAYALNLLLSNAEPGSERLQLVEPIAEYAEIPESCLDTLTVSSDSTTATFATTSTELDSEAAAFLDRFYTLELQANLLAEGPIEFSIVSAESRDYRRPIFTGETFFGFIGISPFTTDFIFDDEFLDGVMNSWQQGLVVFEAGRLEIDCFFDDPNGLLELVEVVGTNERFRVKPTVTAADNGKNLYASCTAFNHDINRLENTLQFFTWTVNL